MPPRSVPPEARQQSLNRPIPAACGVSSRGPHILCYLLGDGGLVFWTKDFEQPGALALHLAVSTTSAVWRPGIKYMFLERHVDGVDLPYDDAHLRDSL